MRYLRLDAHWPRDAGLGVDVATEEAANTLIDLAERTLAEAPATRLRAFLQSRG